MAKARKVKVPSQPHPTRETGRHEQRDRKKKNKEQKTKQAKYLYEDGFFEDVSAAFEEPPFPEPEALAPGGFGGVAPVMAKRFLPVFCFATGF